MPPLSHDALARAKSLAQDLRGIMGPPEEGSIPRTQEVLAHSLLRGTRGYIEKIGYQVNGAYEHGWYDACAVMIRRLLETLIIEAFEYHKLAHKVTSGSGDFFYLSDLVATALSEPSWHLTRNTKTALPRLKGIGDKSAHSRRFNAHRRDIDGLRDGFRVVVQEFTYLAGLK
jgi:hypothetical protein